MPVASWLLRESHSEKILRTCQNCQFSHFSRTLWFTRWEIGRNAMEMGVVSESGPCTVKVGRCRTVKVLCYSMLQHVSAYTTPYDVSNVSSERFLCTKSARKPGGLSSRGSASQHHDLRSRGKLTHTHTHMKICDFWLYQWLRRSQESKGISILTWNACQIVAGLSGSHFRLS